MPITSASPAVSESLEPILALLRSRLPSEQHETMSAFVARYFAQVDPDDLAARQASDLYGAALAHWQFARRREPGQIKLRVFNPSLAEHGWQTTHTVIEIVNDDMPFLVDSVSMEVNRHGLTLHLLVHPLVGVRRAADGTLDSLDEADGRRESFIHVEVDRVPEPAQQEALAADLLRVLGDVRSAVGDWQAMQQRMLALTQQLPAVKAPVPPAELEEASAFLRWLSDNHFTFLGYRAHRIVQESGEDRLEVEAGSGLGILRDPQALDAVASFAAMTPQLRAQARRPQPLEVTKSTARSTVHRPGYLDYVAIKQYDADGQVCGEHRFLGLFTSTAYNTSPSEIPLLRHRVAEVVRRAGLASGSHAGKALINILDTYPRDELFQIEAPELLQIAMGILQLGERQRFRLFLRQDPFERFVSCLIYAPRENYTTELRQRWQAILMQVLQGSASEFNVSLSDSVLARIHITVRTTPGGIPPFDVRELEARLIAAARRWVDALKTALIDAVGEARGIALLRRFSEAFPAGYREEFEARAAVPDIEAMAALDQQRPYALSLYRPLEAAPGQLRFKLIRRGEPLALSDSLPMLECLGVRLLDEHPYRITPAGEPPLWIHDFGLVLAASPDEVDVEALKPVFEEAVAALLDGAVEVDNFNRLTVAALLPARDIVLLRAYARYLRQIGFALSQPFVEATLVQHAGIARQLVALFKLRFAPGGGAAEDAQAQQLIEGIERALDEVSNLSEDRVLRQYLALIQATLRTNFFRRGPDGAPREFLSFKFACARVPGLPAPRPWAEIFVYAPRFEGVHLRGGPVARGGLRWSDRPEDFRTEVLGLVKAQMVKNTVIVPVGSKGGFVLKRAPSPADREAYLAEGVACYQNYLRGLLDLTDNRQGDVIVPPPQLRRHDGDDPYLVVAADKGTASFSDYANAISAEYGFWLGDAFASGGSRGYDHKLMGITARGAWESVKRHFREMGHDTQTQDFSVVGIGDMSGDVFGNGMLLSRHIRLVAAFDHRHIFIDPSPDAERSYQERERLFKLPRSSWADYDGSLISSGGGVWPRSAKSIPISAELRLLAGLAPEVEALPPTELIHALLKAPVDLIYNGGIGTYIKASSESHAQVGDRANDGLRVDGRDLRCKVFAEGGNLGSTQRGRIEYAMQGGRINTDAIDNSAGVDTSDHEVNIKILLGLPLGEGELTEKQRNALLPLMTDEVAALVLRDNVFQTQILSLCRRIAPQLLDAQTRFMQFLEKAARLDRPLEYLPSDQELAERRAAGQGLCSPELAVLLAYSKMWLYDELLASPLPDDPWVATALTRYFPQTLAERFSSYMPRHPLRREIIATHVINSMLNRVGPSFVYRVCESIGARPHEVVRAYLLAREVFGLVQLWVDIEALEGQIEDEVQGAMLIELSHHLERGTTWFLRSASLSDEMGHTIERFRACVGDLAGQLPQLLEQQEGAALAQAAARYVEQGVPQALAARVVSLSALTATLDIAEVADSAGQPVAQVAALYFDLGARLGLPLVREHVQALPAAQHWQMLAKGAMLDELSAVQRAVTGRVLGGPAGAAAAGVEARLSAWQQSQARVLERCAQLQAELRTARSIDLAILSVLLREMRALA